MVRLNKEIGDYFTNATRMSQSSYQKPALFDQRHQNRKITLVKAKTNGTVDEAYNDGCLFSERSTESDIFWLSENY